MGGEASEQGGQIGTGELPLERGGAGFVVPLEAHQALLRVGEIEEVAWHQRAPHGVRRSVSCTNHDLLKDTPIWMISGGAWHV